MAGAGEQRGGRAKRKSRTVIVLGDQGGTDPVVLDDKSAVAALADPLRLRIMKRLSEPTSARELAEEFERPVTSLYHHLGLLERHGLITVADVQREGRTFVRLYARVSDTFRTAGEVEGLAELVRSFDPNARRKRVQLTKRIVSAVSAALDDEQPSRQRVRMLLQGPIDEGRLDELARRLRAVVEEFFDESADQPTTFEVVITVSPGDDGETTEGAT